MAFWNRKKNPPSSENIDPSNVRMNDSLFRDITQEVALFMCSSKIINEPGLRFFHSDGGICEGMFIQHTTNPDILVLKRRSSDDYLSVVGSHALGAGIYVTLMQGKFKKSVAEFDINELQEIAQAVNETDAYELALNMLGISADSQNKKMLDKLILFTNLTFQDLCDPKALEPQNIRAYMQVLFNAGITLVLSL